MKKKLTRKEAEEKIRKFFADKHNAKEVRKIKRLAMAYNIKLRGLRKLFCQKCYSMDLKMRRIKNKIRTVECSNCRNLIRIRLVH